MYQRIHRWEDAIDVAENQGHAGLGAMRAEYVKNLAETGQDEKAGEV